ncbi:hypothetical protein Daura_24505 [Dactylosporangium aurantiacum]|uniref:Knr4/Smi1-like domain-containing protein n=1 Tax=Dactylosporangium aurantiacum TaxID=35754 RepID=A0A9Q9IMT0_9ACTN|nr:SMI1/KNR4 family protein [Dactylosporangium aurantiacum]MDG6103743.1 hypothetical protein [Dactylosporangium aurantiacum]UWZ59042.1 hypothetical protein Daura_24505 [Dactylosporangium aurantiacum]
MVDDGELVFEAVRARVAAGEYLDSMLGLPGVDVEGGGAFNYAPDGRLQRIHSRRDPGFRAARDAGTIPPLPPLTPATPEALRAVEDAAGAPLPALLRRCYLELGNGGFGPGYGLRPAGPGPRTLRPAALEWRWSLVEASLLLICDWGCGIASLIDLHDPDGPMWALDPNDSDAPEDALFQEEITFTEWLGRWAVDGTLHQPFAVRTAPTARPHVEEEAVYEPWSADWSDIDWDAGLDASAARNGGDR